ncbi:MAG: hypothetical protein HY881_15495 [Deltaproteobacteria bacterium]|nr:hypothetical protein [Deltaproteobacteria bacterium]
MIESAAYDLIKAESLQQGIQQGIYHSIRKLLLHGIDAEEVARLLDVDIQTVMAVAQSPEKEH